MKKEWLTFIIEGKFEDVLQRHLNEVPAKKVTDANLVLIMQWCEYLRLLRQSDRRPQRVLPRRLRRLMAIVPRHCTKENFPRVVRRLTNMVFMGVGSEFI